MRALRAMSASTRSSPVFRDAEADQALPAIGGSYDPEGEACLGHRDPAPRVAEAERGLPIIGSPRVVCVCGVRVWCGAACCVTVRCAIVVKSCRASRGPPESCFVACGSSHISATGSTAATQPPAFWSWRTSSSKVSVNRSIRVHSHSPTGVCRRGESRRRGKSRSLSAALPSVGCLWNGSSSSGVFSSTSGLVSGVSVSPS